jgi:uncharacterized protein (TIGR03032 family)
MQNKQLPQSRPQNQGVQIASDNVKRRRDPRYQLTFSDNFTAWMKEINSSVVFTTYEAGRIVMVGPTVNNQSKFAVSERNFGRAMAMAMTDDGFLLSMQHQVWRFQNCLPKNLVTNDGWDRLFLPRSCHVTGSVDVHDIALDKNNKLMAVITLYNCIAELDQRGNFNPIWKPKFIDKIINQDRCHLNGFCLVNGEVKYASIVAECNEAGKWREHRESGGMIIDITTNEVVCAGLSMPHTPRFYNNKLWVLEAGTGWFGWIDVKKKKFNKVTWVPGFARGLRFFDKYALVGVSKPRNRIFKGLPLDEELKKNKMNPEAGICVINLETGKIHAKMNVNGSVGEIYDVGVIAGSKAPFLAGIAGAEDKKFVFIGPNSAK